MAEKKPQPARPFLDVHQEVDRLFQELIRQPWGIANLPEARMWQPHCDLCETHDAIIVEVELPGVSRKDVRVEVEGDILRITGERRADIARQGRHYYHTERHYGRFERQLRLPSRVDRDAISARFRAGILTITLPKKAESTPSSGTESEEVS